MILFILLASLLLAGTAGAVESVTRGTELTTEMPGTLDSYKMTKKELDALSREMKERRDTKLRVMLIDPPCLAKMEAAMLKMDAYVFPQAPIKNHTEYLAAVRQWESTKRECWRTP